MKCYTLVGHVPIEASDLVEWARFMESDRTVKDSLLVGDHGTTSVVTTFIGQCLPHGTVQLFLTEIAGGPYNGRVRRAETWEEAVSGHDRIVMAMKFPQSDYQAVDKLLDR